MRSAVALICGLTFGAGLMVSGMTNPAKVLAFLDIAGEWDPTLAFVMGGGLTVSTAGYRVARRRDRSWSGEPFALPTRQDLDPKLLSGAGLFGVGWGLVGLCPGPALANLSRGSFEIWLFVGAMVVGTVGYRLLSREPALPLPGERR
jgi:uncharacterized membrane protein YedE/YeeE